MKRIVCTQEFLTTHSTRVFGKTATCFAFIQREREKKKTTISVWARGSFTTAYRTRENRLDACTNRNQSAHVWNPCRKRFGMEILSRPFVFRPLTSRERSIHSELGQRRGNKRQRFHGFRRDGKWCRDKPFGTAVDDDWDGGDGLFETGSEKHENRTISFSPKSLVAIRT